MKNNGFFDKIRNSPILWIILSLIISIAMWTYIASEETEEFKVTFRGVTVKAVGEDILRGSRNMVITNYSTPTVDIEVTGPRRIVARLSADDLVAKVDVSKLTMAAVYNKTYEIGFPDGEDYSSLRISGTPDMIELTISELVEKPIPVRGSFDGNVAEGYVTDAVVYEPSTITVTGPEIYVRDIKYAWLNFGIGEDVDRTITRTVPITLKDGADEDYYNDMVSVSTDTVRATLPIIRQKTVPLKVNILPTPGVNTENTIITYEPDSITLRGDSSILDGMNSIVLADIDPTTFSVSYNNTFVIRLPDGVINQTGIDEAKVSIELKDLEIERFDVKNFTYANLTDGYEAEFITAEIKVTVRGPADQINALESANIRAVVDLSDYFNTTGAILAVPQITFDGFPDLCAIGDIPQVSLKISEKPEEPEESPEPSAPPTATPKPEATAAPGKNQSGDDSTNNTAN